jgi:hypothetical protein
MWLALSHHENGQTTITENMPFSSASNFFGKRMAAAVYNPTDVMVMVIFSRVQLVGPISAANAPI